MKSIVSLVLAVLCLALVLTVDASACPPVAVQSVQALAVPVCSVAVTPAVVQPVTVQALAVHPLVVQQQVVRRRLLPSVSVQRSVSRIRSR
jgi:hypothetical protein